jgi:heterotetrameric sarcosine oxidase gamma subunit
MIVGPAGALLALDLWNAADQAAAARALGGALPGPGLGAMVAAGDVLRVGPRRWWLNGAGFDAGALAGALEGTGALTPIAGGWLRVALKGPQWRDLIMQSGLIDAEAPEFGPGCVAVTVLCHARCVVHVHDGAACTIYVPASYAAHCLSHWRALGWRQVAA